MSSNDIILRVNHISKCFEIYEKPIHRLYQILHDRKKFYKEFWALKDISFEVKRGECIGIIGRNGAGKSTLLQIITGTLQPTTGSVELKGRVAALLELGSGFNPEFTGKENVYMNAAILGFSQKEIDSKYQDIIDFADIGDFVNQPVKTYSSGMMVRLAFAVQIMLEPEILIVDEALAVGDLLFQKKCYSRINALVAKGVTFIFVTHDMETMRSMTKKALLLSQGKPLLFADSPSVLLEYRKLLHRDEEYYMEAVIKKLQKNSSNETATSILSQISKSETHTDTVSSEICFGQAEVEILGVSCFDATGKSSLTFYPGELMRFRVDCVSHLDTDHLNVALRIRNKQGIKIYSWGTLNQDETSAADNSDKLFWNRSFQRGERFSVFFESYCNLGSDLYEVQASVSYEGALDYSEQRILHWVDNALFFRVVFDMKRYFFGGCTDMQMKAFDGDQYEL